MMPRGDSRPRAPRSAWSLNVGRPTLADRFFERGLFSDLYLIVAAAAATALLAHVVFPLWPIPSTGQTLGVLLAGALLGAVRGAFSMVLYLALAAAGLPVLADGESGVEHLVGPTGGYLLAFVFAAAVVGWAAQRSWNRGILRALVTFAAASLLILAIGVVWYAVASPLTLGEALWSGAVTLLPGTALKVLLATGVVALGWRMVARDDRQRATDDLTAPE